MKTFKKTDRGTIGAYSFSDGISIGVVVNGNVRSIGALESNNKGQLVLSIFDNRIQEMGITIHHENIVSG